MLLKPSLEKLLAEAQGSKFTELREACQEALEKLKNEKVITPFWIWSEPPRCLSLERKKRKRSLL